MTDYPNYPDAAVIADVATRAAEPTRFEDPDGRGLAAAFVLPDDGQVKTVDVEQLFAPYRAHPRRKSGRFAVHTAEAFTGYLDKHGLPQTEVWADAPGCTITGIVNAHDGAGADADGGRVEAAAGWGDHRVTYTVQHTDAWKAWIDGDGKMLPQDQFAELIETRLVDIADPTGADMLEVAQTFHATVGVRFESSKLLASGERQLEYRETVEATAGRGGAMEVPKEFTLALQPFEGAEVYPIKARFRYRINSGNLAVGYHLERPNDVLRDAFEDVILAVESGVSAPVYRGTPAGPSSL